MKDCLKLILIVVVIFKGTMAYSQVGMPGNNPDPSAALDISGAKKGILLPRLPLASTTDNTANGLAPVKGLFLYNTNASATGNIVPGKGFYYWDGGSPGRWKKLLTDRDLASACWMVGGNSNGFEKAIGAIDNISFPLVISGNNELRLHAGNTSNTSSLKIGTIPAGADSDKVLVTRLINNSYQVFQRDPLLFKYRPQSGSTWKTPLQEVYYGTIDSTYVLDMLYVRIENVGKFATAIFSCQRSNITGNTRSFVLSFMRGGIEPVVDASKNGYKVSNAGSVGVYQSNRLRLTYIDPSIVGFAFDIWISVEGNVKYLNIQSNDGSAASISVAQQRVF